MNRPDFAGIVTGDWHLDRFNRIDDFGRCVDFVIEATVAKKKALDEKYGYQEVPFHFIHTGDGYKTWHPAPIEMNIMHRTSVLREHGIQGFIVVGNHDWPESEDHRGMHCFTEMKTLGGALQVVDEPMILPVTSHNILVGNYLFVPHIPKAKLQRANLGHREYYGRALAELVARCPEDSRLILFSHVYVKEAAVGPSDLVVESERQVSVEDLRHPRLMAVFLGDIHKAQKLGDRPMILYPGSIERVDFGEINDPKGIVYYEVWGSEIKVEFIPTPARKFLHIVADLVNDQAGENRFFDAPENPAEIQPWLEKKLTDYDLKDTIVKLTIRCGPNQKVMIDDRKLSEMIIGLGADRVRSVNYDVITPDQRRAPEITESLSPVAALEKWVEAQSYPEITAQSILLAGKKLIGVQG